MKEKAILLPHLTVPTVGLTTYLDYLKLLCDITAKNDLECQHVFTILCYQRNTLTQLTQHNNTYYKKVNHTCNLEYSIIFSDYLYVPMHNHNYACMHQRVLHNVDNFSGSDIGLKVCDD